MRRPTPTPRSGSPRRLPSPSLIMKTLAGDGTRAGRRPRGTPAALVESLRGFAAASAIGRLAAALALALVLALAILGTLDLAVALALALVLALTAVLRARRRHRRGRGAA